MTQLALPLQLADYAVFDSFWPAGNETLMASLQRLSAASPGPGYWLWGAAATGKTHLLQAVCAAQGDEAMYLPLSKLAVSGPEVLEGADIRAVVCLDDVHAVAGDGAWEKALFDVYNRITDGNGKLLVSSASPVRDSRIVLADLQSRFAQLTPFQLQPLSETDRAAALQLRAAHRGLELPGATARFMLNHSRRDMASLYELLDRLDVAALRAQRRLTVPFVKDVLAG